MEWARPEGRGYIDVGTRRGVDRRGRAAEVVGDRDLGDAGAAKDYRGVVPF
jgi:hypothetical protein